MPNTRSVEIICCEDGRGLETVPLLLHLLETHRGHIPPEIYDPVDAAVRECVESVRAAFADLDAT